MQLAHFLSYAGNPRETAEQVVAQESAGLDIVWVAEAYGFDSPTLMGYLAARTEHLQIGSAILNVFSRTPGAIAQTAAGLDNVSGGRAILGLGASGPQVIEGFHGVPYRKPLTRTREVIDVVRLALRRGTLEYQGDTVTLPLPADQGMGLGKPLKMINTPERPAVPIYMASLGSKSVATAAEIADGWIPHLFLPERAERVWGESLADGRSRRSGELGDLEVVAGGLLAITDRPEQAEAILAEGRKVAALYVGGMGARDKNFYNDLWVDYGFDDEAATVQDLYLSGKKREAAAAFDGDTIAAMNLVGDEAFVRDRLDAFRAAGVTVLNVIPAGPDPLGDLARVKDWVA
ncbi:LLM class F420-dependent oxidoreductase [Salsipaludibacter albus]|uniref:LLM class F420-dependent oxidoreductase n=1 Tax=Salsipaludibacter albus TaxID=2849650 RepID=UPI001EE3CE81|nr:LLM class F420-dependent oxidoreductase [Salsipaludibacter albus]